jgi:hypothetical protein
MTSETIATAQSELRYAYRSASVGQIYSGLVWLASAASWSVFGTSAGVLILLVAAFFIYPVTALVSRLLGSPGIVLSTNPLRVASVTIPIVGALGIPVAGAAGLYEIEWFYPALMLIIGAHYLPFSLLYGMRIFIPLGASIWIVGLVLALWARENSVVGAWFTGLALVGVGMWAWRQNRLEFGGTDP